MLGELLSRPRRYLVALGVFTALFGGSIIFGLIDLDASRAEFSHLGFPYWSFFALTLGKGLGLAAVLSNRWQTLKHFAFAGFMFDLILALGAHLAQPEIKAILPALSLGIWAWAFLEDRRYSSQIRSR